MPSFEEKMNLKLVAEAEKFPILYNYKLDGYSKRDSVDAAWENVAKEMKDTAANCKEKWRNLRTVFVRKLKLPPSESAKKNKKPYYLMEAMQFVLPFVKTQNSEDTPGNVPSPPEPENDVDDSAEEHDIHHEPLDEDNSESTQPESATHRRNLNPTPEETQLGPPAKKRKKQPAMAKVDRAFVEFVDMRKNKAAAEDDPRKMFLLSLLPEIKNLSHCQMRVFRRKVLDALHDAMAYTPATTPSYTPVTTPSRQLFEIAGPSNQLVQVGDTINASHYYQQFSPEQYNTQNIHMS